MRPVEPDTAATDRPRNAARLVEVVDALDAVADVAAGHPCSDETPGWLQRLAAPVRGGRPSAMLDRWLVLFSDELETVRRARNNILWKQPISNGNVAAAVRIAERLLQLAKAAH